MSTYHCNKKAKLHQSQPSGNVSELSYSNVAGSSRNKEKNFVVRGCGELQGKNNWRKGNLGDFIESQLIVDTAVPGLE